MNSAPLPASGDAATANVAGAAPADAMPLDPALVAAQPGAQAPLAFLQFMQMEDPAAADVLAQPELAGALPGDAPQAAIPGAEAQEESTEAGAAGQPLLAAMTMPLTPAMMAMPAALPAAMRLAAGAPERQGRAADAVAATATTTATATDAGAVALPFAATAAAAAASTALPGQADVATAQAARANAAVQQAQPAAAAPAPAATATAGDAAGADGQAAAGNSAAGSTGFGVSAPAAPQAAPRDGGTLALSGPPTAWRQSLQEALGERLNLQLGKNAEQAVIRLEPPMLGRVEISIRHAAGSLEVNITATHSEVLRQLNTVSDNLRSDLAQRQYTDVSVNVTQAPRAQAAAQPGAGFGADAQGRGRQQGQDQDERAPGAALDEANQSTTAFSLGGRA